MLIVVAWLLAIFSPNVFAYSFTSDFTQGLYWKSFPIPLRIYLPSSSLEDEELYQLVEDSINEWEAAVGINIWDIKGVYSDAVPKEGNYIVWSNKFSEDTGFNPATTLAVTSRYVQGTHYSRVSIILNGEKSNLRNNINGDLKKTLLHELGHTISLDHSSQTSIMQSHLSQINELQVDDENGINEAVNITIDRQVNNYVAPFTQLGETDDSKLQEMISCGDFLHRGGESFSVESRQEQVNLQSMILWGLIVLLSMSGFFKREETTLKNKKNRIP